MHKYALRYGYTLEEKEDGYSKEEAIDDKGLTDCLLGISILLPEDGSYSQQICISAHGKEKRELTQKEIFKAWLMLGISLHDTGALGGWQREFVQMHTHLVRSMFNHSDNCASLKGNKDG
jgi:hypothetical protein